MYVLELAGQGDDELARYEAASACTGVEALAPGLATAGALTDRVERLAFTRTASALVGTCDPTVEAAVTLLESAPKFDREGERGVPSERPSGAGGAPRDREGTVRVRARDVQALAGVSTRDAERALGGVLSDRGYEVDLDAPDHELRALFSDDVCALGWVERRSARDFTERKPTDRPFFQPGSMDPMLARALVNCAGAREGARIVDPMCGTGGLLLEAGLVGADVLGLDAQWKMVRGAKQNLAAYLDGEGTGEYETVRGDATRPPVRDDVADGVVFDAPYGRQSKVVGDLEPLVGGALAAARDVAPRAVVVADRSWAALAREAGWTVETVIERRVHGSLVRYLHLLHDGAPY
ncbi:TIGR01177 family methyltransferase [Salinirubellus salinus]|uniref:TIGR01177 family methyltransferase n=1 Tax=Salinirubellus salinus TaxID=1364945 RepID=A0A9E7R070_9EURY|nr:TIGR01177 family methyltransferase [Salinirubellus salinus]UWM53137.1 TIGR01177 family methyltransferase [Salinirubellus salinus]